MNINHISLNLLKGDYSMIYITIKMYLIRIFNDVDYVDRLTFHLTFV